MCPERSKTHLIEFFVWQRIKPRVRQVWPDTLEPAKRIAAAANGLNRSNGLACSTDRNRLAPLDVSDQFRELCLGIVDVDLHGVTNISLVYIQKKNQ